MRAAWNSFSRIIDRNARHIEANPKKTLFSEFTSQSWKYVESNFKHWWWFWSRNPLYVFKDLTWWIRYRTTNRFHVLKMPSMKPGWCDTDGRLLHASFTLLENYVEKEKPFKIIDWTDCDTSREYANEIHDLYLWWKRRKKQIMEDHYVSLENEDILYKEETENLIRLMKIRMCLWT